MNKKYTNPSAEIFWILPEDIITLSSIELIDGDDGIKDRVGSNEFEW